MKKSFLFTAFLVLTLTLTGCEALRAKLASWKAAILGKTEEVTTEASQKIEGLKQQYEETKASVTETVSDIKNAAKEIKEASQEVGEAVEAVQQVGE